METLYLFIIIIIVIIIIIIILSIENIFDPSLIFLILF